MKKIFIGLREQMVRFAVIISLLLFSDATHSQDRKVSDDPELRATQLTEWMKFNLELNENQLRLVEAINMKFESKVEEVENGTMTRRQKIIALRADGQAKDRELKTVFTAQQFQTYLLRKEEMEKQARK